MLHSVTEGVGRPKLQCFRCQRLQEFERFPGRNFPLLDPRSDPSFLVNHKGQKLFYSEVFRATPDPRSTCFYTNSSRLKE